ncbi:sensor histidine kinase [Azospira restricta]|uniref:histidine kinase n=2 Tax=Azospira restricta TaxID=404405 RepID=A0A974SSW4_9RHOO|nr:sensor histidine kinase [Azospira restricta]
MWWLLPPLVILLAVNAGLAYQGALLAVNRAYDRSLTASLKSIAESTHSLEGVVSVDIPYSAFDVVESGVQERISYAVIGPDGGLITGYPDLPSPPPPGDDGTVSIVDTVYRGEPVRLGIMSKRLYDPALPGGDRVTILFAETTEGRLGLARELFLDSMRRQLLLVGVGALLVILALGTAFRPLLALRERVRRRDEEDLTPVPDDDVPSEISPLIDAINHHMERLSAMLQARRRFLADAAHQLRTPLAVLTTQAEYGLRQNDPEEMRRTFASLLGSIRGARRMTNQMLALSHAEAANGLIQEKSRVDLCALAREVALELAPLALAKRIELAFEGPDAPLEIDGNAAMLREMLANLIDNAIRYTPAGGHVTAAVGAWRQWVALRVCDDGPGIPVAERERVFHRFYRILGQGDSEGSGLGLAIVREIVWAHGGTVALQDGEDGRGLCVEIEFPREDAPPAA